MGLFSRGLSAWSGFVHKWHTGIPWLPLSEEPRSEWNKPFEWISLSLATLWVVLNLSNQISRNGEPKSAEISIESLIQVALITLGSALILCSLLMAGGVENANRTGLKSRDVFQQLDDGWTGFELTIFPMALMLAVTTPFRSHDTQNVLLQILAENSNALTIPLVILIAVVAAPLAEEVIFRVILQGALSQFLPPRIAIPVVAIVFSMVHGPVDGVALLPLSLILGYVFHRRHSYLSVVLIHGLFNATMLALALLTTTGQSE